MKSPQKKTGDQAYAIAFSEWIEGLYNKEERENARGARPERELAFYLFLTQEFMSFYGMDPNDNNIRGYWERWGGSVNHEIPGTQSQRSKGDHAANVGGMNFYNRVLGGGPFRFDICNYVNPQWEID